MIVWFFEKDNFFITSLRDIVEIRYGFRIYGNLYSIIRKKNIRNFYLSLSTEEIILGLEMGFLTLNKLQNIDQKTKFFSMEKPLFFDFSPDISHKSKSKNPSPNLNITKFKIFRWRENKLLIKKISDFVDQHPNLNKNNFISEKFFPFYCSPNFISLHEGLKKLVKKMAIENYCVFRDLWQRGFIVSSGIKFGSSFLIYSGPLPVVHSCLQIKIIGLWSILHPTRMISTGRIGTATKKTSVLVYLDQVLFVRYFGLKWNVDLP